MTQKQYIARTPQASYNGVVAGVRFYNGEALIAPHTISPYLDWTIEQIVEKMREDFGYKVTEIEPEPTPTAKPKASRKPKQKRSE